MPHTKWCIVQDNGVEQFVIYMKLGKTKIKPFKTIWQKDTPDSNPRIITAYRIGDKNGKGN